MFLCPKRCAHMQVSSILGVCAVVCVCVTAGVSKEGLMLWERSVRYCHRGATGWPKKIRLHYWRCVQCVYTCGYRNGFHSKSSGMQNKESYTRTKRGNVCIKVKVNYRKAMGFWPLSKYDPAIELWKTKLLCENLEKFKRGKKCFTPNQIHLSLFKAEVKTQFC